MRLKVSVRGGVQGVGFRPFVHRLATEMGLNGWVNNSAQGVLIEVEGTQPELELFLLRLQSDRPPRSFIQGIESFWLDPAGYSGFEIRPSEFSGAKTAVVLPDIATCPDCVRELFDPRNRRYGYPFLNCTNCGPRFSIVEGLPYDRPNTTMKDFRMCPQCQAEYDDPGNRRFHAQPNACAECGPHLDLWTRDGQPQGVCEDDTQGPSSASDARHEQRNQAALEASLVALRAGRVVAIKGIGGFQLLVVANDDQAVRRLRTLKLREEKPFALMFPSLESVRVVCEVSPMEERLLRSPEAPIVLLLRRHRSACGEDSLSPALAPGNPNLGVMLPYSPLHHLLLQGLGFPVVTTSGNLGDEPICTDEREAVERLGGIADLFLVHNRPIARHVDDSIVRAMLGRELVIRRARGYAPLPIEVQVDKTIPLSTNTPPGNVLAVGGHLKNTIALSVGPQIFLSQHIGDLETDQAFKAFQRVIADFQKLYGVEPAIVACDSHPDYLSTRLAQEFAGSGGRRCHSVQHHLAHVLACLAENELQPPALGVSWDGTGYGPDGTVWGGEFFLIGQGFCRRVAHLRQFRLPGGERAVKEPRRAALGLLYELFGKDAFQRSALAPIRAFSTRELSVIETMLARGLNSPLTSSAGRLFDAVASIVELRQHIRFEGQAAMDLEFAADPLPDIAPTAQHSVTSAPTQLPLILDWAPIVTSIVEDLNQGRPICQISASFHEAIVDLLMAAARHADQERVLLSGGCFQNRWLTERAVQRLRAEGFRPYWHQRVPPNDGGLALGQAVAALRGITL